MPFPEYILKLDKNDNHVFNVLRREYNYFLNKTAHLIAIIMHKYHGFLINNSYCNITLQ